MVGTILLLALTVTLFASIFFFVNTFPRPPSQPANQFQANLVFAGSGGKNVPILFVQVTHLAGPTLSGSTVLFYLYSARHTNTFPTPYHISDGRSGSTVWSLGQTWNLNVTSHNLTAPDNITVSIVTTTQLLFRVTLPGSSPSIPPQFVNVGVTPALPAIGQGFQVFAQIIDSSLNTHSVYVNVSQLPGASGALLSPIPMTYSSTTGLWTYNVPGGTTNSPGTFYVFVNASDSLGQPNSVAIPVVIGNGAVTQASVLLSANPSAAVAGSATTLTALVTNPGSSGGAVNVTFRASGAIVGYASGSVGGGASNSFSTTWTPANPGLVALSAVANVTGGGSVSGTLNLTVFPKILFISHDIAAGTSTRSNESAFLAQELTSAGVPFTFQFVSCSAALPSSATLGTYGLVIIDFGSSNAAPCNVAPSTTEQAKITGASTTTSFWIVGADAFMATTCNSYTSAFFALFGLGWSSGGTCTAHVTSATTTASWSSSASNGMRADGVGTLTINQTLAGSNAFEPYNYFTQALGTGGHSLLTAGGNTLAVWRTSGSLRFVAFGSDTALFADALPNGNSWISSAAGTDVTYNVVDYLCGFAGTSSPGRALQDYGVGGVAVWGTSHTSTTTVYAALRSNGPSAGVITVTLYINGSVALHNGVVVSQTLTVSGNGATSYATLVWQAPGAASYTISVVISTNSADLFSPNNQLPATILGQPVVIA